MVSVSRRQKLATLPASLLKNIRGAAALKCYDFILEDSSMTTVIQEHKIFNYFHGNLEQNHISQVDLLLKGYGEYSRLFDEEVKIVTDKDASDKELDSVRQLVLKDIFTGTSAIRYTSNVHITRELLVSPKKTKPNEKATARYIVELAKLSIKNIKKAIVIAEEWLNNGELPSGQTWDDLYHHVLETHEDNGTGYFTGFLGFVCFTKYNSGGENNLVSMAMDDNENIGGDNGRDGARKKAKLDKNTTRSVDVSVEESPFKALSLTLEQRIGIAELSKLEEAIWRDDMQSSITNLNNKRTALLTERSQAMELAKCVCPTFDKNDEYWKNVLKLSNEITEVKTDIDILEAERDKKLTEKSNKSLVKEFIDGLKKSPTKPRKVTHIEDVNNELDRSSTTFDDEAKENTLENTRPEAIDIPDIETSGKDVDSNDNTSSKSSVGVATMISDL